MAAAVAASAAVAVVRRWEVRWGPGVGGGDTCWCRLAAWPACSSETACSTAWWRPAPRARGRRRQETSRRGRSRVAEGPPRPLGSAGCPLAVVSQGARGAQWGVVPWRGALMWRAAAGRNGYGPVCCRNDSQGPACLTRTRGVARRRRTLTFHSWSCSSVSFMRAGPSMPLTMKVCAWSSLVPCDGPEARMKLRRRRWGAVVVCCVHPGVKPLCNVMRRPVVDVLDGPLGWMDNL